MKKILFCLLLFPAICLAANDDISDRPELGTAVNTDSILAVNAGNTAGDRLARILFQGTAGYVLTGNGTWFDLTSALAGKAAALGADDNYVTDAEKIVIGNTSGTNTGDITNLTSFVAQTPWRIFYSNTDGDVTELALGSDGEYLKSNGAALAPSWATPSGAAHDAVTIGTPANGLSISTQELSLGLSSTNTIGALSDTDWDTFNDKQAALVSGTNIKTVNSTSLLGSGDVAIAPMVYPGAGIPVSTGSAWGTSYSLTTLAAALDGEAWTFTGAVDLSGASSVLMGPLQWEGATVDGIVLGWDITDLTSTSKAIKTIDANMAIPAATSIDASGKILTAGLADTDLATYAGITPSANVQSLLGAADYAAMRGLLDLEAGTDFNAYDADLPIDAIEFVIDGGGSAITTGVKGFLEVPYAATINRATVLCDQSGSIVVDVWKDAYANYPPTDADSITASAPPTVSTATASQDATLTGWTTSITSGDIIGFNVDSITTVTRCTVSLRVSK